ncbi:MAG: shikimate kinase [Chloroflexota bacterium]
MVREGSGALILVGLSGSGKSTVGRLVAARLGLPVFDTDRMIEQRSGHTIADLFASRGEAAFRELEAAAVADACTRSGVVAVGGGAVLRADNRARMRQGNLVIWLDTSAGILASRLAHHTHGEERPLLRGDLDERMSTLWVERRAAYAAAAHVRVPTSRSAHSGSHAVAATVTACFRAWLDGWAVP